MNGDMEEKKARLAEYNRAYYLANRDALRTKRKAYRTANADAVKARAKAYREANDEAIRAYRQANADAKKQANQKYYAANRERCKAKARAWREANSERAAAVAAEYRKNNGHVRRANYAANRKARNKWHYEYQRDKAASNPQFAMYRKLVVMMSRAMLRHRAGRKVTGASRIVQLLGCEWLTFLAHIESQFQPGMTWENHSVTGWHFDHIKPLSSFDLTDEEQLRAACHFTNVQPLWAADNVRKGAKTS